MTIEKSVFQEVKDDFNKAPDQVIPENSFSKIKNPKTGKPVHDAEILIPVFDPRKSFENEEDKKAASVVWTTASIELALDAIEKGYPLKVSPFFENNVTLRKPNLLYQYTERETLEIIRCKRDILHFADNYCYLKTPKGFRPIKLRKYQRNLLKSLQENRFNILMMPRQMGKTTTTSIFLAWYTLFHYDKTIALLGQKLSTGKEILSKVKQILAALPFYLKPGIHSWNDGSYSFDNNSRAVTKATTLDSLQGFTIDALYIDEFAYIKKNLEGPFWDNVYPTISANPESKLIISSTPNGKNLFHKLWTKAISGESSFKPIRVYWWEHPDRDEEWKRIEISNTSEEAFAQQYDCSFDTAVKSLLKTHTSRYLKWTQKPFIPGLYDIGTDYEDGFTFSDIFKYEFKEDYFIISVDIAEGLGKDASVIKIYRITLGPDKKERMLSVAKFHHKHIEIEEFAKVICILLTKFDQEKTRLVIERNTFGDTLILQMEAFANNNLDESTDYDVDVSTFAKFRRNADNPRMEKGLRLNKDNKRIGVSGFKSFMDDRLFIETDKDTIEEISNFGEDDKGKYRAGSGNDDLVMPIVNMAYYIKSNNYGWLDLIDEYKEGHNEPEFRNIKNRDKINSEILKELGLWFDKQMVNLSDTTKLDGDVDAGFDYGKLDQIDGLVTSGLITIGGEQPKFKDDLTEYDFDEAMALKDDEYNTDFYEAVNIAGTTYSADTGLYDLL